VLFLAIHALFPSVSDLHNVLLPSKGWFEAIDAENNQDCRLLIVSKALALLWDRKKWIFDGIEYEIHHANKNKIHFYLIQRPKIS